MRWHSKCLGKTGLLGKPSFDCARGLLEFDQMAVLDVEQYRIIKFTFELLHREMIFKMSIKEIHFYSVQVTVNIHNKYDIWATLGCVHSAALGSDELNLVWVSVPVDHPPTSSTFMVSPI